MLHGVIEMIFVAADLLATSLIVGATIWFFFVQSPVLYRAMKREQFVPIQMRLAKLLFSTVLVAQAIVVVLSLAASRPTISLSTGTAMTALVLGGLNRLLIFPKALRAGAASHQSQEAKGETGTIVKFVTAGAGRSAELMHRVVVGFVILMTAAVVVHGFGVIEQIAP